MTVWSRLVPGPAVMILCVREVGLGSTGEEEKKTKHSK